MPEVSVIQRRVMIVLFEQVFVVAFFDDCAFFHHHDSIGGFDGGQAMCDQDAG